MTENKISKVAFKLINERKFVKGLYMFKVLESLAMKERVR